MTARRRWGMAIALIVMAIAACARTPPEQALRDALAGLQAAVQERDAAAVRALLAEDFIGPGGLDRNGAHRLAQGLFLRYRDVGARVGPLDIALQGDAAAARHARVRFDAVVSGGAGGLVPDSGQVYAVETGWRMDGAEWRLVSADWRPRLGSPQ